MLQKNRVLKSLTLETFSGVAKKSRFEIVNPNKKFVLAKKSRFEIVNPSKIRDLKS